MAAMRGRREFAALLLKRGADKSLTDDGGNTAADRADGADLAQMLR